MKVRKVFALSILATSIALAAGCSSDDDDEDTDDMMEPGGMEPGGMEPGGMEPGGMEPEPIMDTTTLDGMSILDIARGTDGDDEDEDIDEGTANADLTTLVGAAGNFQGILNLLDDDSQTLTVFAPSNEAFSQLAETPAGDALERVLSYHVVPNNAVNTGALTAEQTLPLTLDTAVEGATLTLQDDGTGAIVVVDSTGAQVPVGEAVSADNGVVYIIGSVLMPPAAEEPMEPMEPGDGEPTDPGAGGAAGSTLAAIQDNPNLSMAAAIVGDRDQSLQATDASNRSQLLFVPTNSAIDAGATSILAYTVTTRGEDAAGQPAESGTTYMSFADLTGDQAGTKLEFVVAGEGETLTVNGLPAQLVETTSGPVLYVFGN